MTEPRVAILEQDDPRVDELAREAFCYVETGHWHAVEGEDGQLLAIACWRPVSRRQEGLFSAYVRSSARGKGLHRALIRSRCRHAAETGHVRAFVSVRQANAPCLENFRRSGFGECGEQPLVTVAGCLTLFKRLH